MLKNIPPQKMRMIFFASGILCYAIGYVLFSEENYGGSLSHLITIFGIFFIANSFTFKMEESELKIHSLIQRKAKGFPEKAFLLLFSISITLSLTIAYFVFSKIIKLDYYGRNDHLISLLGTILLSFTFSLGEKWKLLKRTNRSQNPAV